MSPALDGLAAGRAEGDDPSASPPERAVRPRPLAYPAQRARERWRGAGQAAQADASPQQVPTDAPHGRAAPAAPAAPPAWRADARGRPAAPPPGGRRLALRGALHRAPRPPAGAAPA